MDDKKDGKEIGIKREREKQIGSFTIFFRGEIFLFSLFWGKAECMYDFRRKSAKENVNVFL